MFSQDECLDKLQRGLEMEEKLANSLSELCLNPLSQPTSRNQ